MQINRQAQVSLDNRRQHLERCARPEEELILAPHAAVAAQPQRLQREPDTAQEIIGKLKAQLGAVRRRTPRKAGAPRRVPAGRSVPARAPDPRRPRPADD